MQRLAVLAAMLVLASPSTAAADCATTCGDICYAPEVSALFRGEVVAATDGFVPRVRIVERLAGSAEVAVAVDDELEEVYVDTEVAVGEMLVLVLANFDDGPGHYQWNVARRIESEGVVCGPLDRAVPFEQYVAMATSPDCEAIAVDLMIENRCDDTPGGCAAAGTPTLLAVLAVLGLGWRRRGRRSRLVGRCETAQ